jgi:hypothetical protein
MEASAAAFAFVDAVVEGINWIFVAAQLANEAVTAANLKKIDLN